MTKTVLEVTFIQLNDTGKVDIQSYRCSNFTEATRMILTFKEKRNYKLEEVAIKRQEVLF